MTLPILSLPKPAANSQIGRSRKRYKSIYVGLLVGLLGLALSNPHQKDGYVQALSKRIHSNWCVQPEGEFCEMLAPLTRPLLQPLIYHYTQVDNYLFFTYFYTPFPCVDIVGLGIGGYRWIWLKSDLQAAICTPADLFLDDR